MARNLRWLPNPLRAGRYHSLIADPELPDDLVRTATYGEVVMAFATAPCPPPGSNSTLNRSSRRRGRACCGTSWGSG